MNLLKIKRVGKRGQSTMDLPFGLIFSIFLIIVFIVITFVGIKYFLSTGRCTEVGFFYRDFEKQVNDVWKGAGADLQFSVDLPSGIQKVCFANMSASITNRIDGDLIRNFDANSNVFLIPAEESCGMSQKFIAHLNIEKIIKTKNPYCVATNSKIRLKKDIYEQLVSIE